MKKLLLASLAVLAMGAQAASVPAVSFTVTAATTPGCVAGATLDSSDNSTTSPTVAFGAYSAFAAGPLTSPITTGFSVSINCTRSVTSPVPTAAFDTANGLVGGQGIVAGLNYNLSATPAALFPKPGYEPSATTGLHNGTADNYKFIVSGSIPAGQAGSATASGTSNRTLTISF